MICTICKHDVVRARIIEGNEVCSQCMGVSPSRNLLGVRDIKFPQATSAHVRDIFSRKVAEDGKSIERKSSKTYIF